MSDHHVWCNFWGSCPASECAYCKRLYEFYPMEGLTIDELQKKYFPDAIKIEGT